ncbi:PAS domain-containing transcriptional regulator [Agarilytica rhodophyticola]|uniref:PAS domain-containing transcriptional regulator n=1 Tax=Agarilytica rhodophyticola TaxID=1737490 RepID=UPI000B346B4F|nr:PAS domain-containing transcriptional regulator [Agarilytica rhodophyticola]
METLQYKLQQFDPGIVWLDQENKVTAMNAVAIDILGSLKEQPLGKNIINFHPFKSQEKVQMLLKESQCPMDSPPPVSMMINAIDRLLMIKVSKMYGEKVAIGTCMVFYDLTDVASGIPETSKAASEPLLIKKLPVYKNNSILLVDLEDVIYIKAEGHYCSLHTDSGEYLCNLSLSDLGNTLFINSFKRVHRSFIVDLDKVCEIVKKDKGLSLNMSTEKEISIPVGGSYHFLIKQHFNLG